jgi:hypothetical protein
MSTYDFVKDYFFACMEINHEDEVPKLFLKSIGDGNVPQIKIWYYEFVNYVRNNEKDTKNLYFNRMRTHVNKDFGMTFDPVFF